MLLRIKKPTEQKKMTMLSTIARTIPLNLFQTWHTLNLPNYMRLNVERLKMKNPEFKHYLFDDEMCRDFIKQYFHNDVLIAFDRLKPGAYKADLWRYCVLYIHGGIYLDIKFTCIGEFKLIYLTNKEQWVRDIIHHGKPGIYQALMINVSGSPYLRRAIDEIVYSCKTNNYESINSLCITGPCLLGKYFSPNNLIAMELVNKGQMITYKGAPILTQYKEYREE